MQGAGFVEGQSAACAVCPAGGLKAHRIQNGQWVNNGPFPEGKSKKQNALLLCQSFSNDLPRQTPDRNAKERRFLPGCGGGDVYELTPGNVAITNARDIAFSNCSFQHLGAYGVSAGGGTQRVSWAQCVFSDISAGALMLGEISDCAEVNASRWNANFTVSDSTITNLPTEYTGASSIFLGYVESSIIEHNLIANTSYSGET
jgi:hypothetical protein